MDSTSQFSVPTIIDVPELIVTNEDVDYDDASGPFGGNSILMNKLQFLSSASPYFIGFGNLFRFPYLCYKHSGGAFLFTYTLILLIVGMPLLLMELAAGQYANEGPITIWRISPAFEGIGYAMCLVSVLIAFYYSTVVSWFVSYFLLALTGRSEVLRECTHQWNTNNCFWLPDKLGVADSKSYLVSKNATICSPLQSTTNVTLASLSAGSDNITNPVPIIDNCTITNDTNQSLASFTRLINSSDEVALPANEFFHNHVLMLSSSPSDIGNINFLGFLTSVLVWIMIYPILNSNSHRQLIDSRHYGSIVLIMPYLVLITLFLRSITLEGSSIGLQYLFTMDWDRLQNIDIWADSITQIFFTIGPCWGGIISLANMNKFHNNFHADTMIIVALSYLTSLLISSTCFATIGYMSTYSGIALSEVVDSGLGLIFQVLPEVILQLPLVTLNSIIMFGIFVLVGLLGVSVMLETVVTTIVDTWPHKLRYRRPLIIAIITNASTIISLLFFSMGNSFYMVQILDAYAGTYAAMTIGILELIAIAWVYGMDNFIQDIDDMISVHRNLFPSRAYWYFMWRYLTPSVLFAVLLFCLIDTPAMSYQKLKQLDPWTKTLGWSLTIVCLSVIPMIAFIRFMLAPQGPLWDRISYLCRPSEDWAPSSYVSGPKLLNRHEVVDDDGVGCDGFLRRNGSDMREFSRVDIDGGVSSSDALNHSSSQPDQGVGTVYPSGRKRIPSSATYRDRLDDDGNDYHHSLRQHASSRGTGHHNDDSDSNEDNDEDLKLVNGKANYIIPEEEDDTDTGLITGETNV